jgi:cell division protein FtsL
VAALACLVLMVFWVYLTKAGAGRERSEIAAVEREIGQEQRSVKLLRAEAAHLEQPARIEALSQGYLGLKPVEAKREAQPDSLMEIARVGGGAR